MMRKSRKKGGARWLLWGLALGAAALLATGGDGLQAQATGSRTPTAESIREKEEEMLKISGIVSEILEEARRQNRIFTRFPVMLPAAP